MVIYVDVLIFTNIIIDFFLLNATSLIIRRDFSLKRLILSSLIGGLSSLYILYDSKYLAIDLLYQIIIATVMLAIAVGLKNIRRLVFATVVFFSLSCGLSGIVTLLGRRFSNLIIGDNMEYYLNISPVLLVAFTAVFYIITLLLHKIFLRKNQFAEAELTISAGEEEMTLNALVDTGNKVEDPFGCSQVFIVNKEDYFLLCSGYSKSDLKTRKRLIPINTVGESHLLEALRCDKAKITAADKNFKYSKPLVAAAIKEIDSNYKAIIPYSAVDRIPDKGD